MENEEHSRMYSTLSGDAILLYYNGATLRSQRKRRAERPFDADLRSSRRHAAALGYHGQRAGIVLHFVRAEPERADGVLDFAGNADGFAVVFAGIGQQRLDRGRFGIARRQGERNGQEQQPLHWPTHGTPFPPV